MKGNHHRTERPLMPSTPSDPNDTEKFLCVRGCTEQQLNEDEAPKPKEAKHGHLCNSCFYRLKSALNLIPDLITNMRAQIVPPGVTQLSERISGNGDGSPAPLRLSALDASDALFAKLVSWTEVISDALKTPQPSIAVWINFKEIQGMRGPITLTETHELCSQLTDWFHVRLEEITSLNIATDIHDDICYGWEDSPGVFANSAKYGIKRPPLRKADKRECPNCGKHEVFVRWPDKFENDLQVLCPECYWVAKPQDYDFYAKLFA